MLQFQRNPHKYDKSLTATELLRNNSLIPKKNIIQFSTPVERLDAIAHEWGHKNLLVKREDQTAFGYGGNKVRNLEYLLGRADLLGAKTLVTPAPMGSNFIAALSCHAGRLGYKVLVDQFAPHRSQQMIDHHGFSESSGSQFVDHYLGHHYLAAGWSFLRSKLRERSSSGVMYIPPGGSSIYGALGHVDASFEISAQMGANIPDSIVVGVGTCGTIAGLLAGLKIQGLPTKVIGVRCVDRIVANRSKIQWLANSVLRLLGSRERIKMDEIVLMDPPGMVGRYGEHASREREVKDLFRSHSEITLDSTYTSKVVLGLRRFLSSPAAEDQSVLYWHTFTGTMNSN